MRARAILGVLLAVTAIFVCLGGIASFAQAAEPKWNVEMTHSTDPFEGDTFIRGAVAGRRLFRERESLGHQHRQ